MPEENVQLMAILLHAIGLFASLMTGLLSNQFGRRPTILLVGILFFSVPFFMGFASVFLVSLGRMVAHVGVGCAQSIVPIYMAEISPAISRGFFTCLPDVFLNVGKVIGCICNFFISKTKFDGWRLMMFEGAISTVLITIAVLAMPESPRWLVLRGRLDDASHILIKTYKSKREADLRLADIKEAAGISRDCNEAVVNVQSPERTVWEDLLSDPSQPVHHMVVLACLIQVFRQACGIDIILLQMPQISEMVGITNPNMKLFLTVGVELVKTIFTVVASFLLDKLRLGRRRLLLISIAGMAVCLIPLGACVYYLDQIDNKDTWVGYLCIGWLFGYVASFAIGLGPVTSVYVSELFPMRLRAQGCAMALGVNQWTGVLMATASLFLHNTISLAWAMFFFAAVACGAWIVFYKIIRMPETRGLTLEEMGNIFGELYQRRSVAREAESGSSAAGQTEMTRRMVGRD
ncbi:polyol transporter 5-like [Rhodamnia argentea]|uniref:Polyol transporter 5-like n=1 Tax=Rhodamnia argentea TaxID=178133 RepID=A0A8B8MP48_9MYRT|nr:polyol transporter 5-like [Rhodamnia argentea]XP_030511442.2 polyol transporter 5-like [Rhodamnia argentea]